MHGAAAANIRQRAEERAPVDLALLLFQAQGEFATLLAGDAKAEDLGPSEVAALLALARGPTPVSGVARIVGIRPNGASVLVDRLHARGLVARERSRSDNRVVRVALTADGEETARRLEAHAEARIESRLSGLTPAEREQLPILLARILS
ncbi:MAG TPA: MarR family transcriptional regulator [Dehalococcoidia bacterium]|nr:MarR family transcriptional regulator [Dehalococcoidia bacterium]